MESYNYEKVLRMDFYKNEFIKVTEKYKGNKVVFYGVGEVFVILNKLYNLKNNFDVVGVSDKKFEDSSSDEYNGFKTIKPSLLKNIEADVVILTLAYPDKVLEILKKETYANIKYIEPFFKKLDPILKYDVELIKKVGNKSYYHLNSYNVNLVSDDYSGIIEEVFFWKIYEIKEKFKFNSYSLYDIGMNRAYTDIYFALDKNCNKCFGFEPFKSTYDYAVENVNLNPILKSKIEQYNYGLSDKNSVEDVYFLPHRDGISTVNIDFIKSYAPEELNNLTPERVELRVVSDEFKKLMQNDNSLQKILKLDAEGAEYQVIPNLYKNNLLEKFNIIVGDMHILHSKQETMRLFEYMYKSGFKTYEMHQHDKTIDYVMYKDIDLT